MEDGIRKSLAIFRVNTYSHKRGQQHQRNQNKKEDIKQLPAAG